MAMEKHSIRIGGVSNSIAVEPEFWDELVSMAEVRGFSIAEMVTIIARGSDGNLASAIRKEVLGAKNREIANLMKMIRSVSAEALESQTIRRRA